MTKLATTSVVVTCALFASAAAAAQDETPGTVSLPLARYESLTRPSDAATDTAYALSEVRIDARVDDDGAAAEVSISATVRVLGEGLTFVPLAARSVAVSAATADGSPADLVARGGALTWPAAEPGTHHLALSYRVETRRFGDGRVLALSTPEATASLTSSVPGTGPGVTVVPATDVSVTPGDTRTEVRATVPAASAVTLVFSEAGARGHTLSRAHYRGRLEGDAVRFEAELVAETAGAERELVPLVPAGVALEDVKVDGAEAAIAVTAGGEAFAVPIAGRGRHRIAMSFRVPVERGDGLPRIALDLVPTPVCSFELRLPGDREVTVEPGAGVRSEHGRSETTARFHVPMSDHVAVQWAEAVPEEAAAVEARAHAEIIHVVRPDEGVLVLTAHARWEITRGTVSRVRMRVPARAQINSVTSPAGVVSDFAVGSDGVLTVFLDREVQGHLELAVAYERPWPAATRTTDPFDVPLLRAEDVSRQRGMIALLSAGELTLEPRDEEHLSRVGDNLLPADVRNTIETTVAHTFRYLDEAPHLAAIGAVRPPEPPRFDAQVDTLVSLGDVSTHLAALVSLDIKNGSVDTLYLTVPEGVSLLDVSAPSLRRYVMEGRRLRIELTQPVQGHVAIEVLAERITGDEDEVALPFLGVVGAEVERGRIGVEARAAFQVDAATVERLSPIDPGELPEQLLLRTDHPILHAYRYAQATPAPELSVHITRHAEIETPEAAVDEALYRTLYTREGLAVTAARFVVRNRRQQFLRVVLPEGSEVWSARVDGHSQRAAREDGSDEPAILVEIVSTADAFPVEIVYATPVASIGAFGRASAELPRLDVVVTETRWELFLPADASYAAPDTSMTLIESAAGDASAFDLGELPADLALEVPARGVRYVLSQMYAGRDGEPVSISIPYASAWGHAVAIALSLAGALLCTLALLALAILRLGFPVPAAVDARLPVALATYRDRTLAMPPRDRPRLDRTLAALLATTALGVLFLIAAHLYLATPAWPALAVFGLALAGAAACLVRRRA